jgi:uncharacterized membrane protein
MKIGGWFGKAIRNTPYLMVAIALELPRKLIEDRFHAFLNEEIDNHAGGFMSFLYRVGIALLGNPLWVVALAAILIMLFAVLRQIREERREKEHEEIRPEVSFKTTARNAFVVSVLVLALGGVIAFILPSKTANVSGPSPKKDLNTTQQGGQQPQTNSSATVGTSSAQQQQTQSLSASHRQRIQATPPSAPPVTQQPGSDNTTYGNVAPPTSGSRNTFVGPTDAHGNTVIPPGTAVGYGAKADSTGVSIGAFAGEQPVAKQQKCETGSICNQDSPVEAPQTIKNNFGPLPANLTTTADKPIGVETGTFTTKIHIKTDQSITRLKLCLVFSGPAVVHPDTVGTKFEDNNPFITKTSELQVNPATCSRYGMLMPNTIGFAVRLPETFTPDMEFTVVLDSVQPVNLLHTIKLP